MTVLVQSQSLILSGICKYTYIKTKIRGMFFNTCHLLDYFFCGQSMRMFFICGESPIFSDQLSDARSYSNRILKQGTVMTLRSVSVNLQDVISVTSIEKAIIFAIVYTGPSLFYTVFCHSYEQQKTLLQNYFMISLQSYCSCFMTS